MSDDRDLLDELDLGAGSAPRRDTLERVEGAVRPSGAPYVAYERDLTEADLQALALPRGNVPRTLVRIHASHHSLARCLATGMKPLQASLVTGYSPGRISQLQRDPAFIALVADYAREAKSTFADLAERMASVSLDALEILHEKMQEAPEAMTVPVLLDIIKAFADRTGYGPNQSLNVKFDTSDLIDRPPRESFEDWEKRRQAQLQPPIELKKLN